MALPNMLTRKDVDEFNGITTSIPKPQTFGRGTSPVAAATVPAAAPAITRPVPPIVSSPAPPAAAVPTGAAGLFSVMRPNAPAATPLAQQPAARGGVWPRSGLAGVLQGDYQPAPASAPVGQRVGAAARATLDAGQGVGRSIVNTAGAAASNVGAFAGDVAAGFRGGPTAADVIMPTRPARAAAPTMVGTASAAPNAQQPGVTASSPPGITANDVIVPSSRNTNNAKSQGGRDLGYGRNVNGVATFSDGSGAGGVPRTMSDAQIAGLVTRPNNPVVTASGNAAPPIATESGASEVRRPTVDPVAAAEARARASIGTATRNAQSDALSIALKDPRSALGIAARNAALDVQYASTRGERAAALDRQRAMIAGVQGANQLNQEQQGQIGAVGVRGAGEIAGANISANSGITQAQIQRQRVSLSPITLEDGTLAIFGEDGIARPITTSQGGVVRPRREPATPVSGDQLQKSIDAAAQQLLGIDPITGKIPDPDKPGVFRVPKPEEIASARQQARAAVTGTGTTPQAIQRPSQDQFLAQARQANPGVSDAELTAYYRANYGQ